MEINLVTCKTALSPSTLPGLSYSLNPYRGCQHNCAYCYAPNVLRIPRERWGNHIEVKTNIPVILAKELKKKTPGVIGLSTVTDPYQPLEEKYRLTRYCLDQLVHFDFPIHIQTKSSLVQRDSDLISRFSNAEVMVSIGTLDDQQRMLLEPNTSSIPERLRTLQTYSEIGVRTSVFFGPIYPTIQIKDISTILDTLIDHGVTEVMIDTWNLKPGIWENVQRCISADPRFFNTFKENVLKNPEYFATLQHEFFKEGTAKRIKIVTAFP